MSVPAAVLWDLDGTLVDTEPAWMALERELVESYGGAWSERDALAIVGNDLLVSAAYIRDHGRVPLAPEQIRDRLIAGVVEHLRRDIAWQPGARELLTALRAAGVPCALVTMSYRCITDVVVGALPRGTFGAVVTGDAVTRGKPHPEPYLTAAAMLGVAPQRCVAVEDSTTGAASAEAAGCRVVVVPHVVDVAPGPLRTVVPTLDGMGPAALLRAAQGSATAPAG